MQGPRPTKLITEGDLVNDGTETTALSAERIRGDFPIFTRQARGNPLTFLDSAASSQKPVSVLETMDRV